MATRPRRSDPPPLATRDTLTVGVGTVVWVVVLVVLAVWHVHLARAGHDWYLATAAVGTGLGILGTLFVHRRHRRLGARTARRPAPLSAAGRGS